MKNIFLLLFVLAFHGVSATQHIVQLVANSDLELAPTPQTLDVFVGDTIIWEGNFSQIPMNSTSVPEGAQSFDANEGSALSYMVLLGGDYEYQFLTEEFGYVTGSFSASFYPVSYTPIMSNIAGSLHIVQENGSNIVYPVINYSFPVQYTLSIYDLGGRQFLNTQVSLSNSGYVIPRMDRGIYILMMLDNKGEMYSAKMWQP